MTTSANPRIESRSLRVVHLLVRVLLALFITFLVGLALCVLSERLREIMVATLGVGDPAKANSSVMLAVIIVQVVVGGALVRLSRRFSWRTLLGVGAVVAAVLGYLAKDDATVHRLEKIEEVIPLPPDAEASYAVLMRYGKRQPASRDFKLSRLNWKASPDKPQEWVEFILKHRAEVEADWEELAPVRQWWNELNGFAHIADLMPAQLDGETLAFAPVRALAQRGCAIATLQALDGQGDAALTTVLPLLEVSRKLQETGRSLLIQMIAIVVERMAMQTASFTLERASVSPEIRARLIAVLSRPGGGEAGARRLVAVERIIGRNTILNSRLHQAVDLETDTGSLRWMLKTLDVFVYNRRATANLLGDFLTEAEELIGRRKLKEHDDQSRRFLEYDARPRFKNLGGRLLAVSAIPAYSKVANSFWKIQDERAALLARVNALPGTAK